MCSALGELSACGAARLEMQQNKTGEIGFNKSADSSFRPMKPMMKAIETSLWKL